MKNDYSKMFAMLRPVKSAYDGMAGFARIELRSGKGALSVNVQGVNRSMTGGGEKLTAALISNDGSIAYECGELIPGNRGQCSMMFEFDPAAIGGLPLDGYTAAAIVSKKDGEVTPLIAGIFGKRGISDWDAAVKSLGKEEMPAKAAAAAADDAPETEPEYPNCPLDTQWSEPGGKEDCPENTPPDEAAPVREEIIAPAEEDVFAVEDVFAPVEKPVKLCADDLIWQGYAYAIKQLFDKYPVVYPFVNASDMLFVKVNMPMKAAGVDHYILGAHANGDEVDVLCVGVPGTGGALPPAGLEGATWRANTNGSGYWLTWQDAYMGYPVQPSET